jgi:hypothetical protein
MRVKISESLHAPIFLISTYPTNEPLSTLHPEFATTNNVSNVSINAVIQKLCYDVPSLDMPAISPCDFVLIRMSRRKLAQSDSEHLGRKTNKSRALRGLPRVLYDYRVTHTWSGIRMSTAGIVVIGGQDAHQIYIRCLKKHGVAFEAVLSGIPGTPSTRASALLKKDIAGRISRIVILLNHTEGYQRQRASDISPTLRHMVSLAIQCLYV